MSTSARVPESFHAADTAPKNSRVHDCAVMNRKESGARARLLPSFSASEAFGAPVAALAILRTDTYLRSAPSKRLHDGPIWFQGGGSAYPS